MAGVLDRKDVRQEERWNDSSVFPTPEAWDEAFEEMGARLEGVKSYEGTLSQGSERLADWLEFRGALYRAYGKLAVYAGMAYSVDTNDEGAAARYDRVRGLSARLAAATAFAEPELLNIGFDTLRSWLVRDSRLTVYGHYLERLEHKAPHLRSAEVEELLGALADPFGTAASVHGVLANTDLPFTPAEGADGEGVEITQGNIRKLLGSPDRALRKSAYENYADAHLTFKNTMATSLSAGVKQNTLVARARSYDSVLEASLSPENIPTSVFYTLLDTFKANLPTWHRYWRARRKMLGVDTLHPFDTFAPLTQNSPEISYEQSVDWLTEALAPLGDEYTQTLRRGALEERWVDRALNRGKRMGAFSSGVQGTHPFIMMSYTDDVAGMSTLAHEFGHSLHSYLSWQTQPPIYSSYSLFVAEVASNFNQAMLRAYLFDRNPDRDFQIALIEEAMANFYRYFFVMPTLARFELEIHERVAGGKALSADGLNTLMADLFAEGYGDKVVMDRARVGITWAQFHTHLYSRFYVFQYATGISGAHALAQGILEGQADAAENYLTFLKAGGSLYPLDALKVAGVDLSSSAPVEATFEVLAGLVERLEGLVGE